MRARSARALVAALLLAACSGGGGSSSTQSSSAAGATSTSSLALRDGQTAHRIGATFQYGGFLVTIGNAVYDSNEGTLLLGVRFRNIGGVWNQPEVQADLDVGGTHRPITADTPVDVPPERSTDVTLTVSTLDGDPTRDGVLAWGRPDRDQPIIHLDDGHVDGGFIPAAVPIDGWAHIGKYAVHLTGGQVQAAYLDLNQQADPGQRVLRIAFDEYANRLDPVNGFYPGEHLTLVRPDGQTVDGVDGSVGLAPMSWTASTRNWIELPVASDPSGDYQLLLSSLSPKGFSTLHPELIERVPIAFHLDEVQAGVAPDEPLPNPELPDADQPQRAPIDVALEVGAVNVPGFTFRPTHLRWDPAAKSATVDGEATYLQTESNPSTGFLAITPQFSFTHLLVSGGRSYTGIVAGNLEVPAGAPRPITIEYLSVDRLDANDAGLFIGPRSSQASSIPLGRASAVPRYPPPPEEQPITASPATAGPWTVQLVAFRVGLLQIDNPPPPGERDLEVIMDVTASPSATVPSLGLSYRPVVQLFIAGADGYMTQARGDSGLVLYNPGETHRQSVTFHVSDTFSPGRVGFVLRSADEVADVQLNAFVETTFGADLGVPPSVAAGTS